MQPTRASAFVFACKVKGPQLRRAFGELRRGRPPRAGRPGALVQAPVAGQSVTVLWTADSAAEFKLTAGKVENLRIAARAFDGLELGPGTVLSFWRQLGRPIGRRGFVEGRELREGCVVPSIAGGLCQLSNALWILAREPSLPAASVASYLEQARADGFPVGEWGRTQQR